MGILDSVLGSFLGGNANSSPLRPILAEVLSGLAGASSGGSQGSTQPGLGGLLERFAQAGHGDVANSWVGNGPNQPIDPSALSHVFGQDQVNQWSQQTGLAPHDLLGQLAQFLPHAVNTMTPNGEIPQAGPRSQDASPFDGPGVP